MLVLVSILTLISVALLITGFVAPGLVIRWGKRRTRRESTTVYGISTVVCAILLFMIWVHAADSSRAPAQWNTADINAASNGNVSLAIQWLQAVPQNSMKASSASPQPSAVLKKPAEYYGQVVKLTGQVSAIKQATDSGLSKELGSTASEMTIVTKDGTHVDFLLAGGSNQVKRGDTISVYGYPAGQEKVSNESGGQTTELVLVGNTLNDPAS